MTLDVSRRELESCSTAEEMLTFLFDTARRAHPEALAGLDLPRLHRLSAMFRINQRAFESYRTKPYAGKVIHLRTQHGDEDASREAESSWAAHARGVETHTLSGDHYSILKPPQVGVLADRLRAILERVASRV